MRKKEPKLGAEVIKASEKDAARIRTQILKWFDSGEVCTVSELAEKIHFSKSKLHYIIKHDPELSALYAQAKEVVADKIERDLIDAKSVAAKTFLLKGLRPQYRDNFNLEVAGDSLKKLLQELRDAAAPPTPPKPEKVEEINPFIEVIDRINREKVQAAEKPAEVLPKGE